MSRSKFLRLRESREKRHGFALTTISVNEMLQVLGWTSLELRKTMTCLHLLYKISGGQIDIDVIAGSHCCRYKQNKARIQRTSIFVLAKRLWNKLPAEIAESNSLDVFKSK